MDFSQIEVSNVKDWAVIAGVVIGSGSLLVSAFSYRLSLKNKREAALNEKRKLIRKNLAEYKLTTNELNALIANLLISEIIAEFISELKKNLGEQFVKPSDITDYIFAKSNQSFIKHLFSIAVSRSKHYAKLQELVSKIERLQAEMFGVLPVVSTILGCVNEILKNATKKPFALSFFETLVNKASKDDILSETNKLAESDTDTTYRIIAIKFVAYQAAMIRELYQQDIDNVISISEKLSSVYYEKLDSDLDFEFASQEKKEKKFKAQLKQINAMENSKIIHDVQKMEACLNLIKHELFNSGEIDWLTKRIKELEDSNTPKPKT